MTNNQLNNTPKRLNLRKQTQMYMRSGGTSNTQVGPAAKHQSQRARVKVLINPQRHANIAVTRIEKENARHLARTVHTAASATTLKQYVWLKHIIGLDPQSEA